MLKLPSAATAPLVFTPLIVKISSWPRTAVWAAAASFVLRGRDGLPVSPEDYLPAYHQIEAPSEAVAIVPTPQSGGPVELLLGCRSAAG